MYKVVNAKPGVYRIVLKLTGPGSRTRRRQLKASGYIYFAEGCAWAPGYWDEFDRIARDNLPFGIQTERVTDPGDSGLQRDDMITRIVAT